MTRPQQFVGHCQTLEKNIVLLLLEHSVLFEVSIFSLCILVLYFGAAISHTSSHLPKKVLILLSLPFPLIEEPNHQSVLPFYCVVVHVTHCASHYSPPLD
jgi:hypothetical protein